MAKILVIDDVADVRLTLSVVLENEGHDVVEADNVEKGINLLKQGSPFDLVITDILMPEVIGTEMIKRVKGMVKSIPVMAISGGGGSISADDALRIAQEDADYLLHKPFTNDELQQAVRRLLNK